MDLLIELIGITKAIEELDYIKEEHPNMPEDYYIRNIIRTYKFN